jgi:hypothetical protein
MTFKNKNRKSCLMKKLLLCSLTLLVAMPLMPGCGSRKSKAKSAIAAIINATATLESVGFGKTPGRKPVRVYKVILQAPHGEHLLLVVGDENVPVTLPKAAVVKVGETELLSCPYLAMGNGQVFAVKTSGNTVLTMLEPADLGGPLISMPIKSKPDAEPPPAKPEFPMEAFKAKLMRGTTIQVPKLDTL